MGSPVPEEPLAPAESTIERIALRGRSLREHTARGTIVNASFLAGLNLLGLAKGFAVAGFLTRDEYAIWGILLVTLATFGMLKQVGVNDRFIQQSDPDQEAAFQRFFSVEVVWSGVFWAFLLCVPPLAALAYGQSELVVPGLVLTLVVPLGVLQTPLWVYYRRMDFVRQRSLQALDPVLSLVVTVALAAAGAGYWSLIVGALVGTTATSALAVAYAPYRFRWRLEPGALRDYVSFSWPLLVGSVSTLVIAQGSLFVGEQELGLAAAGAIALAATVATYAERVDEIVTTTLYPAICAVRDRVDLLFESFVKSNRLALMWGVPFGVGAALFADDVVSFVIGERWRPAVGLIQAYGIIAAANHVGFNWHAFFRARGETRPIAAWAGITMVAFLATVPWLTAADGLDGFAAGIAATAAVSLLVRGWFLSRLFPAFAMIRQAARGIAPVLPGVALVLLARAVESGDRSVATALGEFVAYVVVTLAATAILERALLREVLGYLRADGRRQAEVTVAS